MIFKATLTLDLDAESLEAAIRQAENFAARICDESFCDCCSVEDVCHSEASISKRDREWLTVLLGKDYWGEDSYVADLVRADPVGFTAAVLAFDRERAAREYLPVRPQGPPNEQVRRGGRVRDKEQT